MFAGAAGFTYGGFRDEEGNGPLFSPFNDWKKLLNWEGANSLQHMKSFCSDHHWPDWKPVPEAVTNAGGGELQQVAVWADAERELLVYFPQARPASLVTKGYFSENETIMLQWYQTATGLYLEEQEVSVSEDELKVTPPEGWTDALLVITQLK